MKKTLTYLLIAGLMCGTAVVNTFSAETSGSEEMLLFMEIPPVITASKSETTVAKAPSVVTVWTADDIHKMGLRSLREVFDRTVGFFTSRQYAMPVIGSHGLISDSNTAFLFLIDGHSINSIGLDGAANYWLLPALDKVKQVEILRGPGSTLWGSDGAMAVINVITKDGSDVNGLQVSVDAASNDGQHTANILYGKDYGDKKSVMVSFTLSAENGFPYGTGATTYRGGYEGAGYKPEITAPLDEMANSYEFHTKIKMDNITISAHASNVYNTDLWKINPDPTQNYFGRRETTYIDIDHNAKLSDSLTLETKFFTNYLVTDDHMFNLIGSPGMTTVDEESLTKEQNVGLDMLFTKNFNDVNNLKFGVRGVMTNLDPIITYQGLTFNTGTLSLIALPNDYDKDFAAFVEDDWKALDKLDIILGIRADNDNLLENKTAYMPRVAGIYSLDNNQTVKYCYNTGYVRPSAGNGYLGQQPEKQFDMNQFNHTIPAGTQMVNYRELGATQAEEIYTHDLQYLFNGKTFNGSIDFYKTTLKNYFDYAGVFATSNPGDPTSTPAMLSADGLPYRLTTVNANTIVTDGIEIDAKKKLSEKLDIYANLSYLIDAQVDSFVWKIGNYTTTLQGGGLYDNNKNVCAFPFLSYNLGTDVVCMKDITLNLHVRGWNSMYVFASGTNSTNATYEKLGPANFVDLNVCFNNLCANKSLSASVFAKNLLNSDSVKTALVGNGGYWIDEGISVGAKLSYKFSGI